MKPIDPRPDGIATKSFQPTSGLRCNWGNRQAYRISDRGLYINPHSLSRLRRCWWLPGLRKKIIQTIHARVDARAKKRSGCAG